MTQEAERKTTKSAASIRRRRATLAKQEAKLSAALALLRIECQHHTPRYRYCGSSGNWDRSADCYWIEWDCPDCGKRWTTDQGTDEVRRYPGAVQVKK